ncbi:hypothetical protein [Bradyrhizobium guangzhouense]|uniref:Uncharacterized protein n=1 Tax=Bradyrhizobium guangzhouense TaxID=1325095 RepID=A0AAE5WZ37_9BRAD|nr:hypothetical protein [Bradyrhizobium guangzhouense]QAU45892.1 hypothetical protein XH91_11340 [Bradyrhizobium guangzhouense]
MNGDAGHVKTSNSEPKVSGGDVVDGSDLLIVDEYTILTGAAAAVDLEEELKSLPRIIRMASSSTGEAQISMTGWYRTS